MLTRPRPLSRLAISVASVVTITDSLFEAVEGRDARMIQRSKKPRLALEARQAVFVSRERFGKDFDRDFTAELGVAGPIDFAHPARTDEREDLVLCQSGACGECHLSCSSERDASALRSSS